MATKTTTMNLDMVHTGLSAENREGIITNLNTLLADEHVLYVKTRNYHWNVAGIHFATLHELFEQQYNELKRIGDEVAERIRMLGGYAIGTMAEFSERSNLSENPGNVPSAPDMIGNLLDDHEQIISRVRSDIETFADEYKDEGSADLLVGIMRSHEEMAWMLRSMTEGNS